MKILVTGASGNIGQALSKNLIQAGHDVHQTDKVLGKQNEEIRTTQMDLANLLDSMSCYRLVQGKDAVIHLGNWPVFIEHAHTAQQVYGDNTRINMNMFAAAGEAGVKKFLFASSIQVMHGDRHMNQRGEIPPSQLTSLPISSLTPANTKNPYALSKLAGEQALAWASGRFSMQAVSMRLAWTDTNLNDKSISMHRGHTPTRWDKLDECFSYLAISDLESLVRAILQADLPGHRVYLPASLGTRLSMPIQEILDTYFQGVPLTATLETLAEHGLVDTSLITRETGWSPQFRLVERLPT